MSEATQQLAYIPMIFPDADFSRSEINSLPLIQSIDRSVKELNQNFYEQKQETVKRFSSVDKDIADLKKDAGILKNDVAELKTDIKNVHSEINDLKGDMKVINSKIESLDKRLDDVTKSQNGWFMVLGFLIAAVPIAVAVVQHFMGR